MQLLGSWQRWDRFAEAATKVDKRLLAASQAHRLPKPQRQPNRTTTKPP
jgi:hypothetical protein